MLSMEGKKERRDSTGNIEEILKRKREKMEQNSESEEVKDIFRKSRKTVRSSGKERAGEGEIGDGAREDRKGEKADSVLEIVKNEIREELRGEREEMR